MSLLSNATVGKSKNVFVEYNPNDFFYVVATKERGGVEPNCSSLPDIHNNPAWDVSCNSHNFENNQDQCVERELCINKENAAEIKKIQNHHNGSDEKYANTTLEYGGVVLNTINLGIGVIILGGLIYRFRKMG